LPACAEIWCQLTVNNGGSGSPGSSPAPGAAGDGAGSAGSGSAGGGGVSTTWSPTWMFRPPSTVAAGSGAGAGAGGAGSGGGADWPSGANVAVNVLPGPGMSSLIATSKRLQSAKLGIVNVELRLDGLSRLATPLSLSVIG